MMDSAQARLAALELNGISPAGVYEVGRYGGLYDVASLLASEEAESRKAIAVVAAAQGASDAKSIRRVARELNLPPNSDEHIEQALKLSDPGIRYVITPDLVSRYGFDQFYFNVVMCESRLRRGEATQFVPPGDHYRPRFNDLQPSGAALQGTDIAVEDRIAALPMSALRAIGGRFDFKGKSKVVIAKALSEVPEVVGLVNARSDNFFQVQPLSFDMDDFRAEFGMLAVTALAIIEACHEGGSDA